jgi:hypothetical protein
MSIALHSARLAAQAIEAGADAASFHRRLRADVARPVAIATWLQRRMEGWPGRHVAARFLGVFPEGLEHLASWTRVPEAALRRLGVAAP